MKQRKLEVTVDAIRQEAKGIPFVIASFRDGRKMSGELLSCVCGNLTILPEGTRTEQAFHCSTINSLVGGAS